MKDASFTTSELDGLADQAHPPPIRHSFGDGRTEVDGARLTLGLLLSSLLFFVKKKESEMSSAVSLAIDIVRFDVAMQSTPYDHDVTLLWLI